MILRKLTIIASPDAIPNETTAYAWQDGDDLQDLHHAIESLIRYRDSRLDALKTALASQPPIT